MKLTPKRTDVYGPSDETYRQVATRAALSLVLLVVGYLFVEYAPEATAASVVGLLALLAGLHQFVNWFIEWANRTLLWKNTRRYSDE